MVMMATEGIEPSTARHEEPSLLMSLDDDPHQPSRRLFDLAHAVVPDVLRRMQQGDSWEAHPLLTIRRRGEEVVRWYAAPTGEHYHLLTALCRHLKPRVAFEFGTGNGMSAVAMVEGGVGILYTVDLTERADSWISSRDPVERVMGDMTNLRLPPNLAHAMTTAELVFVDGPKDGFTEAKFCSLLDRMEFESPPIVVFDDIRLTNMVHVWRSIRHPKMDLTSFGHWSGTGVVDWR